MWQQDIQITGKINHVLKYVFETDVYILYLCVLQLYLMHLNVYDLSQQ